MNQEELQRLQKIEARIHEIAIDMELLTTETTFEVVSVQRVLEGMSYHFPSNFSHWSFGRDYERNRTIYEHTGHGIPYEQVWNFDVPKAFLVETSPFALQVLTIAHVYGHVDFFLANSNCQRARSFGDIAQEARNASDRFQDYEDKYGVDDIESVIDAGMALQWHQDLDPFAEEVSEEELRERLMAVEQAKLERPNTIQGDFSKLQTREEINAIEQNLRDIMKKTPSQPEYDLLRYIKTHSEVLRPEAVDMLSVIRNQARALAPSARIKLLNEGWATYIHVHIMRQLFQEELLTSEEHGVFSRFHSAVLRENKFGLNWYRVGYGLYKYIKEKWDKGRFGRKYDECEDPATRLNWDTGAMTGNAKIFEVRANFSDRMAVELFFEAEFIHEQRLYIYQQQNDSDTGDVIDVIVESRPEVIQSLLKQQLTLHGAPVIYIKDGNYNDNRELYMVHVPHPGMEQELDGRYEQATLEKVFRLWGRPVHLETDEVIDGEVHRVVDTYNGRKHSTENLSQ